MTRLNKRDYINIAILISLYILFVFFLTRSTYVYGSMTDWAQQHWVFPEYFRNLFYANHDLFPGFAGNLGGGQNIFNFSYYGLYSPVVLVSYLLPFVPMETYLIIASCLAVIVSTALFYLWLKRNDFSSNICFLISFTFLCSGPLIFHSHRHIMFMIYFPFLLLGLIGIDNYFARKKTLLLVISTFLMVMTSYFFSVGGIAVFLVYGLYKFLKIEPAVKCKALGLTAVKLAAPIMLGVLMSSVLILPAFAAILNGRDAANSGKALDYLSLILPKLSLDKIVYNPYSMGLTTAAIIAVIAGFFTRKKENIVLSAIISAILLFQVFIYALNGTLYISAKVLIPFIPLMCLITAIFVDNLFKGCFSNKQIIAVLAILVLAEFLMSKWEYNYVFTVDALIMGAAIILFLLTKKKFLLYIPIIAICAYICMYVNVQDTLVLAADQQIETASGIADLSGNVLENDNSFFRFSNEMYPLSSINKIYSPDYYQTTLYSSVNNKDYRNFYYNIFNNEISYRNATITNATKNVLFDILMGNKYVITDQSAPIGYDLVETNGNASVYKNDSAFPLGYATDKIMSESDFDALEYPYTSEALLNNIVVNKPGNTDFTTKITPVTLTAASMNYAGLEFQENNDIYSIQATEYAAMTVHLSEPITGKIVFLRFNMDLQNMKTDTFITINGISNKLTAKNWKYKNNNVVFDYVLSSNDPIDTLNIVFGEGDYQISSVLCYTLDYVNIKNISNTIDPFEVDMNKTSGDTISGTIDVTDSGYFILNVPFDKNFTIQVDGKSVAYEKANKAFIGFEIEKGKHTITATYQAPLQKPGILLSVLGVMLAIAVGLVEKRKRSDKPSSPTCSNNGKYK